MPLTPLGRGEYRETLTRLAVMLEILVDAEQAKLIAETETAVPVLDPNGKLIGHVVRVPKDKESPPPLTKEQIAEAEKRLGSEGPWYTTEQVMNHLHSLEL